jgi:hypothetical protein
MLKARRSVCGLERAHTQPVARVNGVPSGVGMVVRVVSGGGPARYWEARMTA